MSIERKKMADKLGRPLVSFRSARSGYEVSIAGIHVDGLGEEADGTRHVYQFNGCFFHGCPCVKERDHWTEEFKLRQRLRRKKTLEDDAFLARLGENPSSPYGLFQLHIMRGCDFERRLGLRSPLLGDEAGEEEEEIEWEREYYNRFMTSWLSTEDRLKPEDAFIGARTNSIKHYIAKLKKGWRLGYYDFTSLYPSVNFSTHNEEWPQGPPDVYIGAEIEDFGAPPLDSNECFGLWKVDILPPSDLRHPLLPQTLDEKLVFHLCSRCAIKRKAGPCKHSDSSRLMRKQTFFTGELKKAVSELGYRIIRVYEVWNWPSKRRTNDMFKNLIRDQYAKKVLSSPTSAEKIHAIIKDHQDSMGLVLQAEDFKPNPAMRALAKFSLNNIWGFLGKREDVTSTIFTDDVEELNKLENHPSMEVSSVRMVMGGDMLRIQYKPKVNTAGRNGNIMLALLTTAYARLQLYSVIEQYEEETVYFDTDAVILHLPPERAPPPVSDLLGELKDEILETYGKNHPQACMTSFSSLGPKCYSYTVTDMATGRVISQPVKMKGVSLTVEATEIINPTLMTSMVCSKFSSMKVNDWEGGEEEGEEESGVLVPQFQIGRCLMEGALFNRRFYKKIAFNSTKRYFLPPPNPLLDTRPFGFSISPPPRKKRKVNQK